MNSAAQALQVILISKCNLHLLIPLKASQGKSAFELLHKEGSRNPIITFSDEIDTMFGGGVPVGALTEFCKYNSNIYLP